jgi:hypothetical protein
MGHRKSSSLTAGGQDVPREKLWDADHVVDREESTTHGQSARSSTNGGAGGGGSGSGVCADASQQLEAERAVLLHSKQAELDAIEDRHDDLVRC